MCAEGQHGWKQLLGRGQWADTHSYLGELGLEELPAGERKRTSEREVDGWTESVPLSGACFGDSQINEDLGLGSGSRLDNQAPRNSRFKEEL